MNTSWTVIFYDHTLMGTGLGRYRAITIQAGTAEEASEVFLNTFPEETAAWRPSGPQYVVKTVMVGDYGLVRKRG